MTRLTLIVTLLLGSIAGVSGDSGKEKAKTVPKSHLEVYGNIPVLHLYGDADAMGTDYGTLLKKPLVAAVTLLKQFLGRKTVAVYHEKATKLEKNLPEAMRIQLRAIARETGLSYIDMVTINVIPDLRCSCLAVIGKMTKDGKMIMGRNLDYGIGPLATCSGVVTVYHFSEGNVVVAINFLGLIGAFTGVNEAGVAFGNMMVYNGKDGSVDVSGETIQLVLRNAAQNSKSVKAFEARLREAKHILPMNVMVVDQHDASVLEIAHGKILARKIDRSKGWLVSTNHFQSTEIARFQPACSRLRTLTKAMKTFRGRIDGKLMKTLLASSMIPNLNLQAVVFLPEENRFYLSMNSTNAAKGPYTLFDVKTLVKDQGNPVVETDGTAINADMIKVFYQGQREEKARASRE